MLSRVSEYSYASLLHCQNEYTLLDSINRKRKKKINKALVSVVFCLWYFVIKLTKRITKSKPHSFPTPYNLLRLFVFTCKRHTKQRQTFDLQVYLIMQWKTFHVVHRALVKHHFSIHRSLSEGHNAPIAVLRSSKSSAVAKGTLHVKLRRRCRCWLKAGRRQWTNYFGSL